MPDMWIVKSGEQDRLDGLESEAARLQSELTAIKALGDDRACRICGAKAELTEEHAPSKKAGNVGRMVRAVIDYAASVAGGAVVWRNEIVQGAKYPSFCAKCNNHTGSWYNPAYVGFARDCSRLAQPENAGRECPVTLTRHRQRIVKQALSSVVATSQAGLTARYPDLRSLLMGKDDRRTIAPMRLWLYLLANRGAAYTGLTIAFNLELRRGHLAAGMSFWPLGWILTIGDVMVPGAIEVTGWTEIDYHDKAPVQVELPCQWALSAYPGDFRGPDEFARDAWAIHSPR